MKKILIMAQNESLKDVHVGTKGCCNFSVVDGDYYSFLPDKYVASGLTSLSAFQKRERERERESSFA